MTLIVDDIVDVRCTEKDGHVTTLTRVAMISEMVGSDPVSAVVEVLTATGLPAAGSTITVKGDELTLRQRDPEMLDGNQIARVTLGYEGQTGEIQVPGASGVLRRGGRVSVRQFETAKDRDGTPIEVEFSGSTDSPQPGTISVFEPQAEPYVETEEQTDNPDALAKEWITRVNSAPWRGEEAGMWMVVDASYEEISTLASPPKWRFRWAFQLNTEKWLPVIAHWDSENNRPTSGITVGNGIKAIPYYRQRDFNTKF